MLSFLHWRAGRLGIAIATQTGNREHEHMICHMQDTVAWLGQSHKSKQDLLGSSLENKFGMAASYENQLHSQ